MGRLRGAQRGLSVLVVPAISCAAICDDHDVGSVTCLQHRFRVYSIHLRGSYTYHDVSKRACPEDVLDLVLLSLVH